MEIEAIRLFHLPVWQSRSVRRLLLLALVFLGMVGVPTLTALAVHRPGHTNQLAAWLQTTDASVAVTMYHPSTDTTSIVRLNDYLLGVLAAEFRPETPMAALQAGAVACRTYVIRAKVAKPLQPTIAGQHRADVTDEPAYDLPYFTAAKINQQYGVNAATWIADVQSAIETTDGYILTSRNEPILAFTTMVTPGRTRAATGSTPIPYLKSVSCPSDTTAQNRIQVWKFTSAELAKALHQPHVDMSKLKIGLVDAFGYVQTVTTESSVWSGASVAAMLNLPSQKFTWQVKQGVLQITTDGIGSGFGMSLHEAVAQAKRGLGFGRILANFYPGTTLQFDTNFVF